MADSYLEGMLVLDIVNAATGDVIWRGWASTDLGDNPEPRQVERYVKMAVEKILDRFPPER